MELLIKISELCLLLNMAIMMENSIDPDEKARFVAFHLCLYC